MKTPSLLKEVVEVFRYSVITLFNVLIAQDLDLQGIYFSKKI